MPSSSSAAEPLRDLVDESLDEAAFLWHRWEAELTSLTRNLDDVWSWTEDRLHGALDGVRVAGDAVIDIASAALKSEDPDRVAAGAAVLSGRTDAASLDALTGAISAADGAALRAILRGVELMGSNPALRAVAATLVTGGPDRAGALCRLKAFRRAPLGDEARIALAAEAPHTQADAMGSLFHPASGQFEEAIASGLRHKDGGVRRAAVEAGVSRGVSAATATAIRLARAGHPSAGPYLKFAALFGTGDDHDSIYAALRVPALQRDAIWALGHLGTARAAESCLAGMRHEPLARLCGEAYCWITGADLVRDKLEKVEPAEAAPAFEDDDLEADLVPAADELWPLPDADAAREHWHARRAGFAPDVRYAHGLPVTAESLMALVEMGPMLRRSDIVLELRARTRGGYDVETRAGATRQRRMMAAARTAAGAGR